MEIDKLDLTIDEINYIVDGYKNEIAAACKEYIDSEDKNVRKLKAIIEDCYEGMEEFDSIIRKAQVKEDEYIIHIDNDNANISYFTWRR